MVAVRVSNFPRVETISYQLSALLQTPPHTSLAFAPHRSYSLAPEALFIARYFFINKFHQEVSHV